MHLCKWKARRAGATITANGIDRAGNPAKIVGIKEMVPMNGRADCVAAIDRNGNIHELYL